jgi:hypothetical protein
VRTLLAVALAVLATAATSEDQRPLSAWEVGRVDGHLEVWTADGVRHRAWASNDDGASWHTVNVTVGAGGQPPPLPATSGQGCVPAEPAHCYRLGGGQSVLETRDGGAHYAPVWQLTAGRQAYLRRAQGVGTLLDLGWAPPAIDSTSLVVVGAPGGHRVIVADQEDGLLVRDPDGRWQRRGFTDLGGPGPLPVSGLGRHMAGESLVALIAAWLAVLAGLSVHRLRRIPARLRRPARRRAAARTAAAGALLAVTAWWCAAHGDAGLEGLLWGVLVVLTLIALSVPHLDGWDQGPLPPRTRLLLAAAAAATGLLALAPYLLWTAGLLDGYPRAVELALAAALLGTAGGALAGYPIMPRARRTGGRSTSSPAPPDSGWSSTR